MQSGIHDAFANEVAKLMGQELKPGDGLVPTTTIGPLINAAGVKKVQEHVDDALSAGAKLVCGGKALGGNFFEPTLITNATKEMQLCNEETFGPLAAIIKYALDLFVAGLA